MRHATKIILVNIMKTSRSEQTNTYGALNGVKRREREGKLPTEIRGITPAIMTLDGSVTIAWQSSLYSLARSTHPCGFYLD
jgi:hypothetical protein